MSIYELFLYVLFFNEPIAQPSSEECIDSDYFLELVYPGNQNRVIIKI